MGSLILSSLVRLVRDHVFENIRVDFGLVAFQVSKKYVSKDTASQIHEKATPFVKWLKEAEEEESSEDEEDDVEIEYDNKAAKLKVEATQLEEDDGDDVDIDAIWMSAGVKCMFSHINM